MDRSEYDSYRNLGGFECPFWDVAFSQNFVTEGWTGSRCAVYEHQWLGVLELDAAPFMLSNQGGSVDYLDVEVDKITTANFLHLLKRVKTFWMAQS